MSELGPRDYQTLNGSVNLMRGLVNNADRLVGRQIGLQSETTQEWRYFDYKAIEWLSQLPSILLNDTDTGVDYTILGSALTEDVCCKIEHLHRKPLDTVPVVPGFYFGAALTGSHLLLAPLISEVSPVDKDIQARQHLLCIPELSGIDKDSRFV